MAWSSTARSCSARDLALAPSARARRAGTSGAGSCRRGRRGTGGVVRVVMGSPVRVGWRGGPNGMRTFDAHSLNTVRARLIYGLYPVFMARDAARKLHFCIHRVFNEVAMKTFPLNAWYAAAYDVEVKAALLPPHDLRPEDRACSGASDGQRRRAGRRLLAPPAAAVQGPAARRPDHLRLPRPGVQRRRPLHPHAVAGNAQPVGLRARLPGRARSTASSGSGPATRRWPTRRKVPDLHWNDDPAWAGDGKLITVKCDYRLVLDNLMDLTHETFVHGSQHRPARGGRGAVRRHAWRPHRHRDALDGGHRRAAVLGRRRSSTPPATRARSTAGRSSASRRRARSPSTSAWRRPAAARAEDGAAATARRASTATCSTPSRPRPRRTCHYFWAFARNYCLGEQRLTHELREGVATHLPRGRTDPRSPAAGHRRAPRLQLLQPQHRRRLDVGAAADRQDGRGRDAGARAAAA